MKINLQWSPKLNGKYKTTIIPLIEKENMLPYLKKFLNLQDSKSNKKMIQDLEKQMYDRKYIKLIGVCKKRKVERAVYRYCFRQKQIPRIN